MASAAWKPVAGLWLHANGPFHIEELAGRRVGTLSGGQCVTLASALATRLRLLLLDGRFSPLVEWVRGGSGMRFD